MKLWPKARVRRIRFHDLRHTTASLLMMAGVNRAPSSAFSGTAIRASRPRPTATCSPTTYAAKSIVEGTYWLTSLSLYTGPAGATGPTGTTRSETLLFSPAKNMAEAVVQSSGSTTPTRLTFSTAVSGSSLSLTGTYPVGASLEASYTATATTVTLWVPSNGTNPPEVQVYTLADPFCTSTFPSTAPVVPLNRVAEAFPVKAGGTVVSGVYYLTALTQYTGPGGATGPSGARSETLRLTPNTDEFVLAAAIAASKDAYGDWLFFRVKVAASSLELTQVCPTAGAVLSLPYTATATTLVIYNASNSTVESYTMR